MIRVTPSCACAPASSLLLRREDQHTPHKAAALPAYFLHFDKVHMDMQRTDKVRFIDLTLVLRTPRPRRSACCVAPVASLVHVRA